MYLKVKVNVTTETDCLLPKIMLKVKKFVFKQVLILKMVYSGTVYNKSAQ